jgi:hypothetical protein
VLVAKDELDDASLRSRSFATYLQQASMQAFDWRIAVGDDMLSVQEFEQLMSTGGGLVAYKNRFIELDADQMTAMLDAASKAPKAPSAHALLQAALEEDEEGGSDDDNVPIAAPRNGATWMRKASRAAVRDALRPRGCRHPRACVPSCGRIRRAASRGSPRSPPPASAACWQTTWGSAKCVPLMLYVLLHGA